MRVPHVQHLLWVLLCGVAIGSPLGSSPPPALNVTGSVVGHKENSLEPVLSEVPLIQPKHESQETSTETVKENKLERPLETTTEHHQTETNSVPSENDSTNSSKSKVPEKKKYKLEEIKSKNQTEPPDEKKSTTLFNVSVTTVEPKKNDTKKPKVFSNVKIGDTKILEPIGRSLDLLRNTVPVQNWPRVTDSTLKSTEDEPPKTTTKKFIRPQQTTAFPEISTRIKNLQKTKLLLQSTTNRGRPALTEPFFPQTMPYEMEMSSRNPLPVRKRPPKLSYLTSPSDFSIPPTATAWALATLKAPESRSKTGPTTEVLIIKSPTPPLGEVKPFVPWSTRLQKTTSETPNPSVGTTEHVPTLNVDVVPTGSEAPTVPEVSKAPMNLTTIKEFEDGSVQLPTTLSKILANTTVHEDVTEPMPKVAEVNVPHNVTDEIEQANPDFNQLEVPNNETAQQPPKEEDLENLTDEAKEAPQLKPTEEERVTTQSPKLNITTSTPTNNSESILDNAINNTELIKPNVTNKLDAASRSFELLSTSNVTTESIQNVTEKVENSTLDESGNTVDVNNKVKTTTVSVLMQSTTESKIVQQTTEASSNTTEVTTPLPETETNSTIEESTSTEAIEVSSSPSSSPSTEEVSERPEPVSTERIINTTTTEEVKSVTEKTTLSTEKVPITTERTTVSTEEMKNQTEKTTLVPHLLGEHPTEKQEEVLERTTHISSTPMTDLSGFKYELENHTESVPITFKDQEDEVFEEQTSGNNTEADEIEERTEPTLITTKKIKSNEIPVITINITTKAPEIETTTAVREDHTVSEDEAYAPIPPLSYIQLIVQASYKDMCKMDQKMELKDSVVKFFRANEGRNISQKQVVILNLNSRDCSAAGDTSVVPVKLLFTDMNGQYDNRLMENFVSSYSALSGQGGLQFKYPITQVSRIDQEMEVDVPSSGTMVAAIVISSVAGVCLLFLTILLIVMRKRQKGFNYGQRCTPVSLEDYSLDNISVYNSVRRKAIRASKRSYGNPAFDDPASITHSLNFAGLANFSSDRSKVDDEFSQIPVITVRPDELPPGAENKNRYANVIPLPETRVQLSAKPGADPVEQYINANYVKGFKGAEKFYIACQAPMSETVDDFWRMIWEQQSRMILMLTDYHENGVEKCTDYLPPSEVLDCHRVFGDFQVTLKKREVREKYIISSLQLKNLETNLWRDVTHMWYISWPYQGVPDEPSPIIAFLIEARSFFKGKEHEAPVVVHCSPGTGRTGTVIAIDIGIREFETNRSVDIPKTVYSIRRDRAGSVQTKDQYAFIYQVLHLYATKLTGGCLDSI